MHPTRRLPRRLRTSLLASTLLASTLVLSSACDASVTGPVPSDAIVRWGVGGGFCYGYCDQEMDVAGTRVRMEWTATVPDTLPPQIEEQAIDARRWADLRLAVDQSGIYGLKAEYGLINPDVGSEWVEVQTGSSDKRVTFDPGNPPPGLTAVLDTLAAIRRGFHKP